MSLSGDQLASLQSRDTKAPVPVRWVSPYELLPPPEPFPDLDSLDGPEPSSQSGCRKPEEWLNKVGHENVRDCRARIGSSEKDNMQLSRVQILEEENLRHKDKTMLLEKTLKSHKDMWLIARRERKEALVAAEKVNEQKLCEESAHLDRIQALTSQITTYKISEESLNIKLTDCTDQNKELREEISIRTNEYEKLLDDYDEVAGEYRKLRRAYNHYFSKHNESLQKIENLSADLEETQFRSVIMEKELLPGQILSIGEFVETGLPEAEYRPIGQPTVAAIVGSRSRLYTVQHRPRAGTDTLSMSAPREPVPPLSNARAWPALGRD